MSVSSLSHDLVGVRRKDRRLRSRSRPNSNLNLSRWPCSFNLSNLFIFDLVVECNALFFGCTQCSLRSDSIESVQCDSCDFGYFLLSVNRLGTASDKEATFPQENQVSMCVEQCQDYGYNYVANAETRKCEYCGPTCTLCSPKFGCLEDRKYDRGFKYVLGDEYPLSDFPYSPVAPSSQFRTAKECADDRCQSCQNFDN